MSTTSSIFAGNSRYAQDFQAVIERATAIASLPISQLNNEKADLGDKATAINSLESRFSSLQNAVESIQASVGGAALHSDISDSSVVSANVSEGALEGDYQVEVASLGAYTSTLSPDANVLKVADPNTQNVSYAAVYNLVVNGVTFHLQPIDTTLTSLTDAINSNTAAGVRATIVNVGSNNSPDYRLAIQSRKLGPVTIQLDDGDHDLLVQQALGSTASYRVNGTAQFATSDSRSVTIAPGLSVDLLSAKPGEPVTISLSRQAYGIANALAAYTNVFNAAVEEVDNNRGQTQSMLSGNSLVYTLSQTLSRLGNYSLDQSGSTSLAALGLTMGRDGKLTFDSNSFSAAYGFDPTAVLNLIGSATSGGFLKTASDRLAFVDGPGTGLIQVESAALQKETTRLGDQINIQQSRVDQLKERLEGQIAAADALIASLEQQYQYISGMFSAMQDTAKSY